MRRHHTQLHAGKLERTQQIWLRAYGSASLVLALAVAIARDGVSLGILLWVVLLGTVGIALVFFLAYWPRVAFIACGAAALRWFALRLR